MVLLRRRLRRCFARIVIIELLLSLRRRPRLHGQRVDRLHLLLQHRIDCALSLQQHHAFKLGADNDGIKLGSAAVAIIMHLYVLSVKLGFEFCCQGRFVHVSGPGGRSAIVLELADGDALLDASLRRLS